MDDALVVRDREALGDLLKGRHGLIEGKRTGGDPICERLALDELHDDELLPPDTFETVERGDVGVIQLGEELGLAVEARHPLGIA